MIVWVRLESTPMRQFYADAKALPFLEPTQSRRQVELQISDIREQASADPEASSVTVTLPNKGGAMTRLLGANPPIGDRLVVDSDAGELFAGRIASLALGEDCVLQATA